MEITLNDALTKLQPQVDITIQVKTTINVTPFVARQKTNCLLLDKVGTGLMAEKPILMTVDNRLIWQVPVILALPNRGRLGQVGTIGVDVQTGALLFDPSQIETITANANQLASSTPLSTKS